MLRVRVMAMDVMVISHTYPSALQQVSLLKERRRLQNMELSEATEHRLCWRSCDWLATPREPRYTSQQPSSTLTVGGSEMAPARGIFQLLVS